MSLKGYEPSPHAIMCRNRNMAAINNYRAASQKLGYPISKTHAEIEILHAYSHEIRKTQVIVEIGTRNGGSARLLAESGRKVITIDILEDPRVINLMHAYGMEVPEISSLEGVQQVTCCSWEWKKPARMSIGLVHVDGDHEYESVRKDYDNFWPMLAKGGYMLFHDVWTFSGVEQLCSEIEQDPIDFADNMVVYQKK